MQMLMQLYYVIRDHTTIVCNAVGEATGSTTLQPQLCDVLFFIPEKDFSK
jgi:hypothetical protein